MVANIPTISPWWTVLSLVIAYSWYCYRKP
jgi:hypothetical protein